MAQHLYYCIKKRLSQEYSCESLFFVGVTGFEPATPWSQTRCATNCATPRITVPHFFRLQAAAPPDPHALLSFSVVGVTGFEPATPWSQTRCATNCATPRNCFHDTIGYHIIGSRYRSAKLQLFFYFATFFNTKFSRCGVFFFSY